tara:strand:+ start:465 stop:599 length:135 start_codon:yes stop_codon:yes gene_type:complete
MNINKDVIIQIIIEILFAVIIGAPIDENNKSIQIKNNNKASFEL